MDWILIYSGCLRDRSSTLVDVKRSFEVCIEVIRNTTFKVVNRLDTSHTCHQSTVEYKRSILGGAPHSRPFGSRGMLVVEE
jgi:hypothetical protein